MQKFINYEINKQIIFVYEPYLKTLKLGYCFIALHTHRCGKLDVKNRNFMILLKTKIQTESFDLQISQKIA